MENTLSISSHMEGEISSMPPSYTLRLRDPASHGTLSATRQPSRQTLRTQPSQRSRRFRNSQAPADRNGRIRLPYGRGKYICHLGNLHEQHSRPDQRHQRIRELHNQRGYSAMLRASVHVNRLAGWRFAEADDHVHNGLIFAVYDSSGRMQSTLRMR